MASRIWFLSAFALSAAAAPFWGAVNASAQGRPDSLRMSCGQVVALMRSRGAVVIGTGPHIYDRFVADRRFCSINEVLEPAWIRTRDGQCQAAYRCKPASDYFWWD